LRRDSAFCDFPLCLRTKAPAAAQRKGPAAAAWTVDAFDLDRQRQLVIIRRDNVEHLLMIGGPNDLVIESQSFVPRAREPRDFRDARFAKRKWRDKEPRDAFLGLLQPKSPSPYPPSAKCRFRPPPYWNQRPE